MIELARFFNQKLDALCQRLSGHLSGIDIHLVYSDAMSVVKIDRADFLSSVDAWHPCPLGHSQLADSASQIVLDQARFLGWDGVL